MWWFKKNRILAATILSFIFMTGSQVIDAQENDASTPRIEIDSIDQDLLAQTTDIATGMTKILMLLSRVFLKEFFINVRFLLIVDLFVREKISFFFEQAASFIQEIRNR
jgi:chemotaxis protein CheY-P-specific phosphatase CheC